MADLLNQMLGKRAYGADSLAPVVNLQRGAQMGWQPNFRELPSNTPYVRRPMIPILVRAPLAYQYMENGQLMTEALKVLMEEHPINISGIQFGLTPDYLRTPVGGAGQEMAVISNMTRAVSNPNYTWQEKYNKAITRFWERHMTWVQMDPESKYSNVVTNGAGRIPEEMLENYSSFVMLYIEPDPTHQYVVEAVLCANMQPASGVPREMGRDLTAGMEGVSISMEFTSVTQSNAGVLAYAQTELDRINLTGVNPNNRPAFVDRIHADVQRANSGYRESIATAAQEIVRP